MPIPQIHAFPAVGDVVELGSIAFNAGELDGVDWTCSALDGWDSPALREDLADRALAHGAFRGTSYYGVRELTLRGLVDSRHGIAPLRAALDLLAFETDLTDVDGLLVRHEDPSKQLAVRRAGRPRWEYVTDRLARFEVDLTAADPRKYATAQRSLTLTNGQEADAPNAGTFRGGAPMQLIFTGAGTLEVGDEPVTVTGPVEVDTLEGTALADGLTVFSRLASTGPLPSLPARSATPLRYVGAGSVTVRWRDAWI